MVAYVCGIAAIRRICGSAARMIHVAFFIMDPGVTTCVMVAYVCGIAAIRRICAIAAGMFHVACMKL